MISQTWAGIRAVAEVAYFGEFAPDRGGSNS
jgi:hypothetical protein